MHQDMFDNMRVLEVLDLRHNRFDNAPLRQNIINALSPPDPRSGTKGWKLRVCCLCCLR